jgi:RHS repeat-associated protein
MMARVAATSDALEVRVRYLDGFGRVLQEKVRVEAGPAIQRDASGAVIVDAGGRPVLGPTEERWQVSGHVVYDAKGQPGRMYEPYFSPSAAYEGDAVLARFGVSTLTTYDAVGRPVRVDLPNGTYATTTHGAWATTAATPGDTVLDSTYRVVREGRPVDDAERVAYEHAAGHAGTPTVTYVDARGAACATRAVGDASAADAWTRQVLDATGQAGAVIDARGLTAFTYVRDLRGRVVAQASVDAGPTWALADAYDRPVWTWDGRGFAVTRGFDVADRPTTVQVTGGDGAAAMDAVVETYRYGDEAADRAAAVAANTVGRLVEVKDGAGVVSVSAYDPLGAVRAQGRRLRATVDEAPDWRGAEAVESEVLATAARTDALGREVRTALADGTTRETVYARGGAMVEVRVTTPDGALVAMPIVADVARDAHGRVVAATLGNGVGQTWAYDPASGRLVAQDAVRLTRAYQGLRCTYDPDGKLVRMLDVAQDGPGALVPGAVSARRDFGYDAHGRLVEATGRVHQALLPHDGPTTAGCVHGARHLSLNNGAALERYTQQFTYDAGGNLTRAQHAGTTASWATDYWVAAGSNRATPAEDGNGVPVVNPAGMFDAGGNLRELWHLRAMGWSWRGCLTHATTVARPSGPVDDGERYAYGADRVRVRKVATRLVVGGAEPVVETREVVYCGGGQERVRVARNGTLVLERWTTHVSDGDRRVAVIDRHVVDTLANEVDAIGPARVRYHLTTPQGSTAVELDEAGLLVSYEEYLPHGGSAFIAGDDVREVARRDVRYAGKERDRATGLDAYPQRYYAPWLGRWLSPDPIGPKDGLNLYAFVGGDPVGYVDPEGTDRRAADEECRSRGPQIGRGDPAVGHQAAPPARASAAPRFLAPVQPESFQPFVPPLLREPQGSEPSMADGASGSDTAKSTADVGLFDPFGWFAGSTAGTDTTAESDPASAIDPVDYEALFPVEPAAFAYDQARIEQAEAARTSAWAALLRDPDALDRLRHDAEIPHSPAAFVWEAALDFMRYSGTKLAEETGQYRCMVPGLREASSSDCVKKWDELDKLLPSAKEGPSLLREALLDSYEARALEVASRNQLIGSAANAVLSVLAIRSALRVEVVSPRVPVPAGAATGRGAVAEAAPPKAFSGAQARENADALAADTGRASVTAPSAPALDRDARVAVDTPTAAASVPRYSLPLAGPPGQSGVMLMSRGLRPADFGLAPIVDDPILLRLWNESLRDVAVSRRGAATGGNAYQRYLTAIERGEPLSQPMLEDAFGAVNKTFLPRARAAGYDIATVHHWNWPKAQYPGQVVDPRNLIPIPEQSLLSGGYHPTHYGIHQLTSSGTNVYVDPTGAIHVIPIEKWMSPWIPSR